MKSQSVAELGHGLPCQENHTTKAKGEEQLFSEWWFNSRPLQSVCRSAYGQDTELQIHRCVFV